MIKEQVSGPYHVGGQLVTNVRVKPSVNGQLISSHKNSLAETSSPCDELTVYLCFRILDETHIFAVCSLVYIMTDHCIATNPK